jgi:hypothetical protein
MLDCEDSGTFTRALSLRIGKFNQKTKYCQRFCFIGEGYCVTNPYFNNIQEAEIHFYS